MRSLWDESGRSGLISRLGSIRPDSSRKWGTMDCVQMLVHLEGAMRMSAGELELPARRSLIRYLPFRQWAICWLPWPKGAQTLPELVPPPQDPSLLEQLKLTVQDQVRRFAEKADARQGLEHPILGRLSRRTWGRLTYKHIDHHLRQFGV